MEIETQNGSKIQLLQQKLDLGRGLGGFNSTDRTVSRHHLSFNLHQDGTRVYFQVNGKNPIWVHHCNDDHHHIRVYKSSGELKIGDSFCMSSKNPVWFHLTKIASQEDDDDDIDISQDIDPVKEFNFVVMGHEFDCYTKKMIRDIKNWNWFLEEPDKDSDDDISEKKTRKGGKKKRRKGDDDDDDVWIGESEEDVELVKKSRNDLKPKYSTRSKDKNKKGASASNSAKDNAKRKVTSDDDDEEEEEEDDDDETLGGFIVDDEDIGQGNEENDEEEEFQEDEDDE